MENIDGDLVLLDSGQKQIHRLNETASLVWEGLAAGDTAPAIADRISSKFDVSPATVLADVEKIVKDFENLGLLEEVGE